MWFVVVWSRQGCTGTDYILYRLYTVQIIYCTDYTLYRLYTVPIIHLQIIHCTDYTLYSIEGVYYCTVYSLERCLLLYSVQFRGVFIIVQCTV